MKEKAQQASVFEEMVKSLSEQKVSSVTQIEALKKELLSLHKNFDELSKNREEVISEHADVVKKLNEAETSHLVQER